MLKKRLFSLLLCISLLLGLVPMSAAAGDPVVFNPTAQGPVRYTVNGVTKTDTLEKAWNAVASSAGGTLTLRQDITAQNGSFGSGTGFRGGALVVPRGCQVTLDLAGRKLDRKLTASSDTGSVLIVEGELTIKDSNDTGRGAIMGGSSTSSGGGITVRSGGTLNLQRGGILANASQTAGGGIYNQGTVNMTGGKISDNKGGGVYQGGVFKVSGGASIAGNSGTANTYLPANRTLTVSGLSSSERIGVSVQDPPTNGGSVPVAQGTVSSADTARIVSDQLDYTVALENGKLVLKRIQPEPAAPAATQPSAPAAAEPAAPAVTTPEPEPAEPTGQTVVLTFFWNDQTGKQITRQGTVGQRAGSLPAASREGFQFKGWYTDPTAETEQLKTDTIISADKTRYYAHWVKDEYTVSFNLNGGDGTPPADIKVQYGQPYPALPTASQANHVFDGWYTQAAGGYQVTTSTTVSIAADHTLYAHWRGAEYEITLDKNDEQPDAVRLSTHKVAAGGSYGSLAKLPTPVRDGYTFAGWYKAPDGNDRVTDSTPVLETTPHTLYAHWSVVTVNVIFNPNGGTVSPTAKTVTYGEPYGTLPTPTPPAGHTAEDFQGWYPSKNGGIEVTAESLVDKAYQHTLYAVWEPQKPEDPNAPTDGIQWLISFHNTDENLHEQIFIDCTDPGGSMTLPQPWECGFEAPAGEEFAGWAIGAPNTTPWEQPGTNHIFTANTNVYAKWTGHAPTDGDYTVTYLPGGDEDFAPIVEYRNEGDTFQLRTNPESKPGRVFSHWTDLETGLTYSAGAEFTMPAKDVTFFAVWKQDEGTVIVVTYDANGGAFDGENGNFSTTTQNVHYGDTYILPLDPMRQGGAFAGWFTAPEGGSQVTEDTTVLRTDNHTLYAHWAESVTLTLYSDLGDYNDSVVQTVAKGSKLPEECPFERSGSRFAGWSKDASSNTPFEPGFTVTADTKAYATWEYAYTVTLNANGGLVNGKEIDKVMIGTLDPVYGNLPDAELAGHSFRGWYTGDGTGPVKSTDPVSENITLYAQWSEQTDYTIHFDSNGGSGSMADAATAPGGELTLPECTFTAPVGKVFDQWAVGSVTGVKVPAGSRHTFSGDTTVYALWKTEPVKDTYTITYDANGGGGEPMPSDTATAGELFTLPFCYYTPPAGMAFEAWAIGSPDSQITVKAKNSHTFTQDTTVYAVWKTVDASEEPPVPQDTVTIHFDVNHDSTPPIDKTAAAGSKYGDVFPTPSREGYTLTGWFTDALAGTPVSAEQLVAKEDNNRTLYAHWTEQSQGTQVRVTFDENYDGAPTTTARFAAGSKYTLPSPSRTGYAFVGWFRNKNGGVQVTENDTVSPEAHTLYALWREEGQLKLTFESGEGSGRDYVLMTDAEGYMTLPYPDALGLTAPTGKVFDEWEITTNSRATERKKAGERYQFTEDTVFTAIWKDAAGQAAYTVIFDLNYTTTPKTSTETYLAGEAYMKRWKTPTRPGHLFDGWYTEAGEKVSGETIVSADITLYAHWKANNLWTATFTPGEGTGTERSLKTDENGHLTIPDVSEFGFTAPEGKVFGGWKWAPDQDVLLPTAVYRLESDLTLYAYWIDGHVVTYNENYDGGAAAKKIPYSTGETYGAHDWYTPVREGYRFLGWFDAPADGNEIKKGDTVAADITLYAHWSGSCTITYHANGGSGIMQPETAEPGKPHTLAGCGFANADSTVTFYGWAIGSPSGTIVAAGDTHVFTADTTVYAIWRRNSSSSGGSSGGSIYHPPWSGVPSHPGSNWGQDDDDEEISGGNFVRDENAESENPAQVVLKASAGSGGTISPNGEVRVERGKNQSFTIKPNSGYIISDVLVDNTSMGAISSYTFENVQRTHSIEAIFTTSVAVAPTTPTEQVATVPSSAGMTDYLSCPKNLDCPISFYSDIVPEGWYHDGVHYCLDNSLMTGTTATHFDPAAVLTRGMLAQILYNQAGQPAAGSASSFTDVMSGAWYEPAVQYAAGTGLAAGYENGAYGPNDPVTREQLVVVLWRHAGSPASGISVPLSDFFETRAYADEAMRWAYGRGIISGKSNGLLDPSGQASRAEVAQMLKSYFDSTL